MKKLRQYRKRMYHPDGRPGHFGYKGPANTPKREEEPYGPPMKKYPEKLVPVEKEKHDTAIDLELEDSKFGAEAALNDFALDEQDLEAKLEFEREPETVRKEFLDEEEDLEAGFNA